MVWFTSYARSPGTGLDPGSSDSLYCRLQFFPSIVSAKFYWRYVLVVCISRNQNHDTHALVLIATSSLAI
jgi:hypothetical protein